MSGRADPGVPVAAALAEWDDWVAAATDRLMDIDDRVATAGSDALRLDVAAAFVCRKAIVTRLGEVRSAGDAARFDGVPLRDDHGAVVASDLPAAASLLAAVLDRVEAEIAAGEHERRQIVELLAAASRDLAAVDALSGELGESAQRVAAARHRVDAAGRAVPLLAGAVAELAALRAELELVAAHRERLLRGLADAPARLDRLRAREREVRELVATSRAKVRPQPPHAVPSVDALGDPPGGDAVTARPWPAVRADVEPWLGRLDRAEAALDEVAARHGALLRRRDELRGLLHAYRAKAAASGLAEDASLEPSFEAAEALLWSAPCDLDAAAPLVDHYVRAVNAAVAAMPQIEERPR